MKIAILGYLLIIVLVAPYFIQNITFLLNPGSSVYLFQGRWDLVLLYITLFSIFSIFIIKNPLQRGTWKKSTSMYVAFIIALFTEMFGIPLTAYLLSSFVEPTRTGSPAIAFSFQFLGTHFDLLMTSLIAGIFSIIGMVFIVLGWREIYKNKNKLVTNGVYRLIRHPQYFGILLIATAWVFAWPTLLTIIMWPILTFAYYKLARSEERFMIEKFGKQYTEYRNKTPMILPYV